MKPMAPVLLMLLMAVVCVEPSSASVEDEWKETLTNGLFSEVGSPRPPCSTRAGYDESGDDFARVPVVSVAECSKLCTRDDRCGKFAYLDVSDCCGATLQKGDCYLKRGSMHGHGTAKATVTMGNKCPVVPSPELCELFPCDVPQWANGIEVGKQYAASVNECSMQCRDHPTCHIFIFKPHDKMCYLKRYDKGFLGFWACSDNIDTATYVSGTKCIPPAPTPQPTPQPTQKCSMRIDKAEWIPKVRPHGTSETLTIAKTEITGSANMKSSLDTMTNMNGKVKNNFDISTKGFIIPRGLKGEVNTDLDLNVEGTAEMVGQFDFKSETAMKSYTISTTQYLGDVVFYTWTVTLQRESGDCPAKTIVIRPQRPGTNEPYWIASRSGERPQCFAGHCANIKTGCQTCTNGGWLPRPQNVDPRSSQKGYPGVKGGLSMKEKLEKVEGITEATCSQQETTGLLTKKTPCNLMDRIATQERMVCGAVQRGKPMDRVEVLFKAIAVDETWEC